MQFSGIGLDWKCSIYNRWMCNLLSDWIFINCIWICFIFNVWVTLKICFGAVVPAKLTLNKLFHFCPWRYKHVRCTWNLSSVHNSELHISVVKSVQLNMFFGETDIKFNLRIECFWISKKPRNVGNTECIKQHHYSLKVIETSNTSLLNQIIVMRKIKY